MSSYHFYSQISSLAYINQRIQNKVLRLTHKSLKTGHLSYLRSLISLTPHALYVPHLLSHSFVLLSLLVSKCLTYYSSTPHWSCGTVYLDTFIILFLTPLLLRLSSSSCISDLSTSVFLKKLKSSLSHFLSTLNCTHLSCSRADIPGIDLAWLFHLIFISYQLFFTSFINAIFCSISLHN